MKGNSKASRAVVLHHPAYLGQRAGRQFTVAVEEKQDVPMAFHGSRIHLPGPSLFRMNDFNPGANPFHGPVRAAAVYKQYFTFSPQRLQLVLHLNNGLLLIINRYNDGNAAGFGQIPSRGRLLQPLILPHSLPVSLKILVNVHIPQGFG